MLKKILLSVLVMLSLSACETLQSAGTDKYSTTALKENLKVGVTTPDEVRRIYGEPDRTSDDPSGPRSWVYFIDDSKNALIDSAISFIPLYGVSTAKNAVTETRNLMVFFQNNRVSDYALDTSNR
jgi:predicted small secreted protein